MATRDIEHVEDSVPSEDPNNNKNVQEIFPYPGTNVKSFGFHIENEGAATRSNLDLSYAVCRLCL